MDCPGPHISHGNAGIFDASICQESCLGVLPGAVEGSLGPAELFMQTPHCTALQLPQGCVGLFHKGESCLDV